MLFASAATGVRQGNVAGFPAIRTVVEPVCAHAYVVLALADGAVLLAGAVLFRLVAHHANDRTGHGSLQGKLYLTMATRGKARVFSMRRVAYPAARYGRWPDFSHRARRYSASALRFFDGCVGACYYPSLTRAPRT